MEKYCGPSWSKEQLPALPDPAEKECEEWEHGKVVRTEVVADSPREDDFQHRYPLGQRSGPVQKAQQRCYEASFSSYFRAFTLDNFMSEAECAAVIQTAERKDIGFRSLKNTFKRSDRQHDRLRVFSEDMAATLFDRLLPHLNREDIEGRIPIGFGQVRKIDMCI
jgi:hypothetical protein